MRLHFTDGEAQAQRGQVTFPESHSMSGKQLEAGPQGTGLEGSRVAEVLSSDSRHRKGLTWNCPRGQPVYMLGHQRTCKVRQCLILAQTPGATGPRLPLMPKGRQLGPGLVAAGIGVPREGRERLGQPRRP